ncbi:MAG: sodium:solute symporter [Prevotellaceae bacterium]|nr:sodium:solute symporter [Prevotellaceae bacterium]
MLIITTILIYFTALYLFSRLTNKSSDNDTFFRGNRKSPWYMVAFGMVGASISGVTLVSVPGMVTKIDMTYLQTCFGFIFGYFAVAFILLPVYYRHNLTTIYTYLGERLGRQSYKTGAWFFLLSKMTGAAVRFYVVCIILQRFVFDAIGLPFGATVIGMVALIWFYTRRGGIKTLVWTDTFQTTCLFTALTLITVNVAQSLNMSFGEVVSTVASSPMSRIFVFDDAHSTQYFWKQFLSGIFIVIVMTGLDQDMMQKNLTCKTLREAQKDMCTYGVAFVPANLLLLSLGVLLVVLSQKTGVALPQSGDELLPMFAASGELGELVVVCFTIGIVAASFSSADSALTSLTTSFCVDICQRPSDESLRRKVHLALAVLFVAFILLFRMMNSSSVIDAIYTLCSYTYGPLLGLFAFALTTSRKPREGFVPFIALLSPCLCYVIDQTSQTLWNYRFGYELLMLNGLLTFIGLWLTSSRK